MKLGDFMAQMGRTNEAQLLGRLAGTKIFNVTFFRDDEQATSQLESWMPLYFFPIATQDNSIVGLHLLPPYLAREQLPILLATDDGGVLDALCIEVATSLENYLYRCLLEWEEFLGGRAVGALQEAVELATHSLGYNFYQIGRHRDELDELECDSILVNSGRGSAFSYYDLAINAEKRSEMLRLLQEGIFAAPTCLALYSEMCQLYHESGLSHQAAQVFVKSLNLYHHTSYYEELETYYELGRQLFKTHPDLFTPLACLNLMQEDKIAKLRWIISFWEKNQLELSAKLLLDLCYDQRQFDNPAILAFLRTHYQHLGWQWAMSLCDVRDGAGPLGVKKSLSRFVRNRLATRDSGEKWQGVR